MAKSSRSRAAAKPAPPPEGNGAAAPETPPQTAAVRDLVPPGAAAAAAPAAPPPKSGPGQPPIIQLTVTVIQGDITRAPAPLAVVGQYQGLPPAGPVKLFDLRLKSWISRALEYGMAGCGLGQLSYIPTVRQQAAGVLAPAAVIMAGMGEPGHLGRDDLRFLWTNVTLAVSALEQDEFSTTLMGSRRGEMPLHAAVLALLQGMADGLSHLPEPEHRPLKIAVVEADDDQAQAVFEEFSSLRAAPPPGLALDVVRGEATAPPEPADEPLPADLPPEEPTTRITITRGPSLPQAPPREAGAAPAAAPTWVFQYAALAETAVIPVRHVPVQAYFAERLPGRLMAAATKAEQESFGRLLASYLVPEDFQKLIEGGSPLTLVLDAGTALYPWEMAAYHSYRGTCFFGTDLRLARQFRTLLSAPPGLAPALNQSLRVLLIADPAPAPLQLPGARAEGLAVLRLLEQVRAAWGGHLDLKVTARVGAYADRDALRGLMTDLRQVGAVVESAGPCDALELLSLIVNESYDVVHYAGHGVFDPDGGRMGWVFDRDCVLSAAEIFRVRQVPRLVFANACHSAEVEPDAQRREQVGLAEAFFARGIQNYVGAGWAVDDALATRFAVLFYGQALGLRPAAEGEAAAGTAPPATLGESLAASRRAILHQGSTWGAYQHYGQSSAKLLAFPNLPANARMPRAT
jgi:hypothetical protein